MSGLNSDWIISMLKIQRHGDRDTFLGELYSLFVNSIFLDYAHILYLSFDLYEVGGPVFIRIGGEDGSLAAFLYDGAWIKWAIKHKAALFFLEHRYYGGSRPTSDLETKNLQWLSSRFISFNHC